MQSFNHSQVLLLATRKMLTSKIVAISLLTVSAALCTAGGNIVSDHYEESVSYSRNPECKPSNLDRGVKCSAIGPSIKIKGGFVSDFFFNENEQCILKVICLF